MWDATVDDHRARDAATHSVQACRELWAHTTADPGKRLLELGGGGLGDERDGIVSVAEPARHVGQEHGLVGAECSRHDGGRVVGVDVVGVTLLVGADAGDHRDVVGRHVRQHADVHLIDAADEADVLTARGGAAAAAKQHPVVTAQADGRLAVAPEQQHDVLVDLADQHHLRELDGLGVGDAQPIDELHRQVEALHVGGDLRAASVDDHGVDADVLEQRDVARELVLERRIGHRRSAVLDHHRASMELADVGQRLEQRDDVTLGAHRLLGHDRLGRLAGLTHVVYSALIVTYSWPRSEK